MKKIFISLVLVFSLFLVNITNAGQNPYPSGTLNECNWLGNTILTKNNGYGNIRIKIDNIFIKIDKKNKIKSIVKQILFYDKLLSKVKKIEKNVGGWESEIFSYIECKTVYKINLLKNQNNNLYIVNDVFKNFNAKEVETLKKSYNFGNLKVKIYKEKTGKKYIGDAGERIEKSRYFLMKNDNDFHGIKVNTFGDSNIRDEIKLKIKITSPRTGNYEKTIFEKVGPDLGFCAQDSCNNSIEGMGFYNNKLFFTSYVNLINGKYFPEKKYIYDLYSKKLIEKNYGDNIKSGKNGVYYIKTNSYGFSNNKLILLDGNYNEKILFEDNYGESRKNGLLYLKKELYNYELLSDGRIKLFLRSVNSKGEEYSFSKIIKINK